MADDKKKKKKKLIDEEKDTFLTYRYVITEFFIIINGKSTKFPIERIVDFKIEHYFDAATFPIFKINCVMEASRWYELLKNKKNVKFKIRIQSFYRVKDDEKKSMMVDVLNDTFRFFPDEGDEDLEIDLKKEKDKYKDDDVKAKEKYNNLDDVTTNIELFLFKDSYINGLRQTSNYVLSGVNLQTAVTYLLSKAGVNKVLMSPFENTRSYGALVLPPQSVDKQLRYLNNNYGFHKQGSIVYFGLLHSYILNFKAGCTAWYEKEWKDSIMLVLEKMNPFSTIGGTIQKPKEKKYYYNIPAQHITIQNSTVSDNVINGTDAAIIDMKTSKTTKATTKATYVGSKNTGIVFNNSSNPYAASVYTAQENANTIIITCVIEDAKLEALNPNKNFTFVFENPEYNKKYKGSYRLTSALHTFKGASPDFQMTSILTFKKVG